MKKKYLLAIPFILLASGCNRIEGEFNTRKATIMCPTGGPAVALSCLIEKYDLETTADPSLLTGYFGAEKYDAIVAPTDVGVKAIQQGANYKLAATITFGNFYLVSTGLDEDSTLNEGDSIVLFQKNGLPDKIFHYIYGTEFNSSITYVSNVAVAATAYENKKVTNDDGEKIAADYVLLAEPKLTALNIESDKIVNLNEKFEEKSGIARIFQASIFTKSTFKEANKLLSDLKDGIENMTQKSQDAVKTYMGKVEDPQTFFGMPAQMAQKCINNNNSLGIGFLYAKDAIPALKNYLDIIGVGEVDESIFKE